MKTTEIIAIAKQVKIYIEKNHKFPYSIKQNGKTYNYGEFAYYFAEFIKNNGKEVKNKSVKNNQNPSGVNIDEQISESDYRDQCKRISQFVLQNGMIPNYVTSVASKKKIRPQDYIYAFSKIIVYYATHNQFPRTCRYYSKIYTAQSTVTKKKYGHSTKSGCDNMGQNTGYYCACHSLQEVIRNLYNIAVPQRTLASWMGTTSAGTSHNGLLTGVATFNKVYKKNLKAEWKNFSDLGWNGIKKVIDSDNKDCIIHNLYRNQYGHYEVINNVSSNITVQNSLGSKCGSCYCGYIEYRTQSEYRSYINGISQKSIMVLTRS